MIILPKRKNNKPPSWDQRTQLIHELKKDAITNYCRGSALWKIVNPENPIIVCEEIYLDKTDGIWKTKTFTEADTPPFLNVPFSYLGKTKETNPEWREKVIKLFSRGKQVRKEIKKLKKIKQKGDRIWLYLKPTREGYYLNVDKLYLVSCEKKIYGRDFEHGKKYSVAPRFIDKVELVKVKSDELW